MLNRLQERYDPENDVPPGPAVTWADMDLADAILKVDRRLVALTGMIEPVISMLNAELEKYREANERIQTLESRLSDLVRRVEEMGGDDA